MVIVVALSRGRSWLLTMAIHVITHTTHITICKPVDSPGFAICFTLQRVLCMVPRRGYTWANQKTRETSFITPPEVANTGPGF